MSTTATSSSATSSSASSRLAAPARWPHRVAIPLAVLTAAAVAVDTVMLAATGRRTMVTDDSVAPLAVTVVFGVLLGLTFAAQAAVVHAERARFAAGGRLLRVVRLPLQCGLLALALGIGVLHPIELLIGLDPASSWATASALAAFAMLIVTQVSATATGLATLRRNPLGIGGRLLSFILPTVAATVVLGAIRPDMADPAFVSVITVLGVAFIGVGPSASR